MPTPATLAEEGLKALNAQDYAKAIDLYTKALKHTPESPDYYIKRSTAYQRSSNYPRALQDAEMAVALAYKRGKRELISNGQLRRGISLLMEGRIGDAGFCFSEAERKAVGEKEKNIIGVWKRKLELQLANIDEDDVRLEVTVSEIPDVQVPLAVEPKGEEKAATSDNPVAAPAPASAPTSVVTPPSRIRHEWYQTATHVVLTIYVKGVPKDKATVEIEEKSVAIAFPLPTGSEFTFDACPLFDEVNPKDSTFSILSTKIEVKLAKRTPSRKWADLEAPEQVASGEGSSAAAGTAIEAKTEQPSYPTSSKTGPKDWDKVANELTSRPKKGKGKGNATDAAEDQEGPEYDSDYEGGDPVNHFFKKLYKDADEDTRRAMMKSYVESNGTALSTNWKEVGKAKVETSPPDGMVAKHWDS